MFVMKKMDKKWKTAIWIAILCLFVVVIAIYWQPIWDVLATLIEATKH